MELKIMFGDYEITVTEEGNELTISAQRDGEVEEEFTLSKEGESGTKSDSGSEMKGFDEFEDDDEAGEESDDDWDEDDDDLDEDDDVDSDEDDDVDSDEDDDDDLDEDDDDDLDEDDKIPSRNSGSKMVQSPKMGEPKLESFSNFMTRNKRR